MAGLAGAGGRRVDGGAGDRGVSGGQEWEETGADGWGRFSGAGAGAAGGGGGSPGTEPDGVGRAVERGDAAGRASGYFIRTAGGGGSARIEPAVPADGGEYRG